MGAWMYYPTSQETLALESQILDRFDSMSVSYNAEVGEWMEYLKLDKKYLPKYFYSSPVSFNGDKELNIHTPDFQTSFKDQSINAKSSLSIYLGFNPEKPTTVEFHGLSIAPKKDIEAFTVMKRFNPNNLVSKEVENVWQRAVNKENEYSGKAYQSEEYKMINLPLLSSLSKGRSIASTPKNLKSMYIVSCVMKETDSHLLPQRCSNFTKSFKAIQE
jgi:hypothetical protein